MFYTGLDPRTMKPVYVPVSPEEKQCSAPSCSSSFQRIGLSSEKLSGLQTGMISSAAAGTVLFRMCIKARHTAEAPPLRQKQSPFAVWSDGTFGNQTKRCAAANPFRFPEQSRSVGQNSGVQGKNMGKTSDKRSGGKKHR